MEEIIETEICLIGLGPAGIGFLWKSLQSSTAQNILCTESRPPVQTRDCVVLNGKVCDFKSFCHVTSGFGGSSLMAGGKLSSYPAGKGLEEVIDSSTYLSKSIEEAKKIYQGFLNLKEQQATLDTISEAEKLYNSNGFSFKHYFSSLYTQEEFLQAHIKLQEMLLSSFPVMFNTTVVDITKKDEHFLVKTFGESETKFIKAKKIVLAVGGKSGYQFLAKLQQDLNLPCKPNKLEIGIRIEFPIEAFSEIDKYHNDLKLKRNGCKTFCISKGGKIALYLKDGLLYTEGYDNYLKQTEYTNLGLLHSLNSDNFDTLNFYSNLVSERKRRKIFKPIRQNYSDFIEGKESTEYISGSSISCFQNGDINSLLPNEIGDVLRENLKAFVNTFIMKENHSSINVFFPELNYGGFNFQLNSSFESINNFYLIGECSGKFIGILQAMASGLICFDKINNGK